MVLFEFTLCDFLFINKFLIGVLVLLMPWLICKCMLPSLVVQQVESLLKRIDPTLFLISSIHDVEGMACFNIPHAAWYTDQHLLNASCNIHLLTNSFKCWAVYHWLNRTYSLHTVYSTPNPYLKQHAKHIQRNGETTCLPPMWTRFDSWSRRHVGWDCCWFSTLLWEGVLLWVLWFSPPNSNSIPIRGPQICQSLTFKCRPC